ncbi:hypothetical protein BJ912DRAFT_963288 [Pholiota molesta]|nr:hypothetical protein BJ912DRAFT_963288 [Pholiota molesta]
MADPNLAQILTEKAWYVGDYIASVLLGVQLSLFIQSSYYLAYSPYPFRKKAFLITYGGLLCVLVGITLAGNQVQGLLMWIDHRDVPGGPEAYLAATISAWYDVFGTAAIITADIMGNALLMYRCYVLVSNRLVILPALLFIASSDLGVLQRLVTSLICGRIFVSYLTLQRMGHASNARERWGVIALLIESSLPFSVFGIPVVSTMADIWGGIVGISPHLIILRVAMGNAWTKNNVSSGGANQSSMQLKTILEARPG